MKQPTTQQVLTALERVSQKYLNAVAPEGSFTLAEFSEKTGLGEDSARRALNKEVIAGNLARIEVRAKRGTGYYYYEPTK